MNPTPRQELQMLTKSLDFGTRYMRAFRLHGKEAADKVNKEWEAWLQEVESSGTSSGGRD
jgi:hypothetical protein